jgi:hypothetical protein
MASQTKLLGSPNGLEISNKATILSDVDLALGVEKPPSVEIIHVENFCWSFVPVMHWNVFGHIAVRYTLGNQQYLVDIENVGFGKLIVNFLRPEDFFYGTQGFADGSNRLHGLYNRNMFGLRIETYNNDEVENMHEYFMALREDALTEKIGYSLFGSPLYEFMHKHVSASIAIRGNCTEWITQGLHEASLIERLKFRFPKQAIVDIMERAETAQRKSFLSRDNINYVFYRRIGHAYHTYTGDPNNERAYSLVSPSDWAMNQKYFDLAEYADCIVHVPENTIEARILVRKDLA